MRKIRDVFQTNPEIGIIVYVEMVLRCNRITGVHSLNSAGQFMPLFIALSQLIATAYRGIKIVAQLVIGKSDFSSDDCYFTLKVMELEQRVSNLISLRF